MSRLHRDRRLWLILAGLIACGGAQQARANGASFATTGTGTFAPSVAWLDFTGYNDAAAAAGGQAFSFTLPNGAGTLATTGLGVKDSAGNARNFTLTAADGENTNSGESITYAGSAAWQLLQADSSSEQSDNRMTGTRGVDTFATIARINPCTANPALCRTG